MYFFSFFFLVTDKIPGSCILRILERQSQSIVGGGGGAARKKQLAAVVGACECCGHDVDKEAEETGWVGAVVKVHLERPSSIL